MNSAALILIAEAMGVYLLVLGAHALRRRYGMALFYALLGGLTALMSWITDAGVKVEVMGITFMVGSTVFYTSLLLGVFVVYVFDGPQAARIAIATVMVVSILAPVTAAILHYQMAGGGEGGLRFIPIPSLRINTASVAATFLDLIFLAVAWELLGRQGFERRLWLRTFVTLLGVLWLDVLLFATAAFAGTPQYLSIMQGTLFSRLGIALFACPFLWFYLQWQSARGETMASRPVLAILSQVAQIQRELTLAQQEIERRKALEREREKLIADLQKALAEIKCLRGFLPICANCKKIRNDQGYWEQIELYIQEHSDAKFSHGICPDCIKVLYPDPDNEKQ